MKKVKKEVAQLREEVADLKIALELHLYNLPHIKPPIQRREFDALENLIEGTMKRQADLLADYKKIRDGK